ncbi:aminodeoxychorismate/anthranilate synthase component II [Brevibacillus ruminantium]|uniref:Aminodeoxychorismate/anthranilate synthase component II n=1 Tax=Brevibacillus ruminantium TaxID=2950604 RepID=A0ABY4WC18_9BACL|nr:aminodeoxychorismate/anthranilate synthase component II [Brevibacillus ruminantium]USG64608.1 aminodeoxychorismate/anthranilate synthase component II [Brevibacillus ruminantium]
MIFVLDNYDSFVYNLVQYFGCLGIDSVVRRNDQTTIEEIQRLNPTAILISPGPCSPSEAGLSMEVIRRFAGEIPILGVCLGHQAIGQVFGAAIRRAKQPMHGKVSLITHDRSGVFANLENPLQVVRYHSLVIDRDTLPDELEITALSDDGEIMGIRHKTFPIHGVQFHPESIFTSQGMKMLDSFIATVKMLRPQLHL